MLYNNFTEKLIDLQGVEVKNIETTDTSINIFLILKRKKHKCISCGCETDTVHDYRTQSVKDIPAFGKNVNIILRKRRYRCPTCGKRFAENNSFLPIYRNIIV